ncbi:coiled-coil domain-containing protein 111 [Trypanosoma grayi]|uniref:coiled-coil domain-containing protein 111 n=1 Tax=Trypanosoma grayi TaxID=71804 RepID=UPI0004F42CC8|nr:coiled-coil domain-containing protein 111 [Trypanosoma grayi]KEG06188.1 coiled-coil domain-containing protein 111 [Trypanosoma grayi]
MFLAATAAGVARVVREVEPLQQHLYEVIREGAPCHLYLDVERERDYSAWRPVVEIPDSNSSGDDSGGSDEAGGNGSSVTYECRNVSEYKAALATAMWRPQRCCAWDCDLHADNSATTAVLLAELREFLLTAHPALVAAGTVAEDTTSAISGEGGAQLQEGEGATLLSSSSSSSAAAASGPLGAGAEAVVMRSLQRGGGRKFSQHYVVKFDGRWFSSNADVGRIVGHFVDYLYERAVVEPRVHVALFYHDPPKEFAVLPNGPLPFLPLRCLIDTAVYSRNRMLRCLGSCKLHKTSVLAVEGVHGTTPTAAGAAAALAANDVVALFFASLVTLPVGRRSVISMPPPSVTSAAAAGGRGVPRYGGAQGGGHGDGNVRTCLLEGADGERYRALAEYVAQQWRAVGGVTCSASGVRQCGERHLLLLLDGSRYCGNVGREHRSNRVYIIVDLQQRVWAQKCFDPDCCAYRGTPQPIPDGVLPHDRHDWTGETTAAARATHAALRTAFQPPV